MQKTKKPYQKKIRAGALLFAVIVGLLATIVCSMGLVSGYHQNLRFNHFQLTQKSIYKLNDGIQLLLTGEDISTLNRQLPDFFAENRITTQLKKSSWGLFELAHVQVKNGNAQFEKTCLIGTKKFKEDYALYLADQSKPLALCGKTILKGNCYLPKAGVKRAYIEGKNFVGDKLIDGKTYKSKKELPEIDAQLLQANQQYLSGQFGVDDSLLDISFLEENSIVSHSFQEKTLLLYLPESYSLDDVDLTGNVRVVCNGQLSIASNCKLNGTLLYASAISIDNGFTGNLQAFATDSIIVKKEASLHYPSSLALLKGNKIGISKLVVEEGASINGVVYANGGTGSGVKRTDVEIQKDSKIHGQLFVSGNLDLKGEVHGSVTAEKMSLTTNSGTYDNHLLDAVIDATALSKYYVGPLQAVGQKQLVKWM